MGKSNLGQGYTNTVAAGLIDRNHYCSSSKAIIVNRYTKIAVKIPSQDHQGTRRYPNGQRTNKECDYFCNDLSYKKKLHKTYKNERNISAMDNLVIKWPIIKEKLERIKLNTYQTVASTLSLNGQLERKLKE